MNKEEKQLFLDGFRLKIELLNNLHDKLNTLISGMENCKPIDYSGMPRGGTGADIADKIGRKQELEQRIENLTEKIDDMRDEISQEIDNNIFYMKINEATRQYYVHGKNKTEIAYNLGYSERSVTRYIKTGIDLIFNN